MKSTSNRIRLIGAAVALCTCLPAWHAGARDLSLAHARAVMSAAMKHAVSVKAPGGAIAIVDSGGSIVALERMDNTFPAAADVSIGKARTAAAFRKPTRDFEKAVNGGRFTMIAVAEVTRFTPLQGGVPIVVGNEVVGAIGVSGASSAQQDDEIAQTAADSLAAARRDN